MLTTERLREVLTYDPITGKWVRNVDELDAAMAYAAAKLELHIHYGDDE